MKYFLVSYYDDWADEFDLEGFIAITEEKWTQMLENAQLAKFPNEQYFGTNEFVVFESFDDWKGKLSVKEITEAQYSTLKDLNLLGFGDFIIPQK